MAAKTKRTFVCAECGGASPTWRGQCPRCGAWNTLAEKLGGPARIPGPDGLPSGLPIVLGDHPGADFKPFPTGIDGLDRVLGGGLTPGGAVLLGGEPGIGKSTLLLQLAGLAAAAGRRVVYVSGEESLPQLKSRAERLGVLHDGLLAASTTDAGAAVDILGASPAPDLVILDSVQTMHAAGVEGPAGSVSQVRAVAAACVEAAKRGDACLILVGHVTKDGQIAGPKLLEHMVDTVLYLEGERRHLFRILRVLKNRYGPTDELLVMEMREAGLNEVPDPSTFFLGDRDPAVSGSAVVMAMEGRRPFAVEVQALAAKSFLSMPRRAALGLDVGRLHLLLAVLEKRLRLNLGQTDIYAKIGGGLKIADPGLDLGIAAAVLSSFYDRPLPAGAVFWGEVDLSGRIRPAAAHDTRLKQAERLGYGPIISPDGGKGRPKADNLGDLARLLFS
ncbi:DNA repair protein RadA [Solidesulfovibrio magneticus]|uniref:DNA repair protein RadA n=1 Tax=Solidesulfovibrio magneticus (strain ATCC 700980 / DSM 13731 / RS-1) TaxID=573370 RepID=C4XS87_SOLM1|nr:DNA repair protein RadA [Solidesulfovibrio magneticus]BAH75609.1 DNA repair protein RadA [Solidesulfovibrio magneticus RS-1]